MWLASSRMSLASTRPALLRGEVACAPRPEAGRAPSGSAAGADAASRGSLVHHRSWRLRQRADRRRAVERAPRRLPHRVGLEAAPARGDVLVGADQTAGAGPGAVARCRAAPARRRGPAGRRASTAAPPGRRQDHARRDRQRRSRASAPKARRRRRSSASGRSRNSSRVDARRQLIEQPAGPYRRSSGASAQGEPGTRPAREGLLVGRVERREVEPGRGRQPAAVDHAAGEVG